MKIVKEPYNNLKYSFEFEFALDKLEFCRRLRDSVGFKNFFFYNGKWRFDDINIIERILTKFPETELDRDSEIMYRSIKFQKDEEDRKIEKSLSIKNKLDSDIKINGLKKKLYGYQKVGVEFIDINNGKAIVADQMGCLSGDTIIQVNKGGNCKKYSLRDAYIRFNDLDKRYTWKLPSYMRSYDEEKKQFTLNKVKEIILTGKKHTVEIKAKNKSKTYKLQLTLNHEIMTPDRGWIKTKNLKIGDKILCNGKLIKFCPICRKKTEHSTYKYSPFIGQCKKCIYRFKRNNHPNDNYESIDKDGYILVGGLYYHPSFKKAGDNGIRKHILVYEAFENNISYDKWIKKLRFNKFDGSEIFIDSTVFSIHHKNGIKDDNRLENLKKYIFSEHQRIEGKEKNYKNFKDTFIPDTAKIISIKDIGVQEVYDVIMEDPHRSFIANGIVVHNSGKSAQALAYCLYKKLNKILVICPASVKYVWEIETEKWTSLRSLVLNGNISKLQSMDFFELINNHDVFIINYDLLKKFYNILSNIKFDCCIMDEFHYIKNSSAQRTKVAKMITKKIPSIILLSGTPLLNRPVEMFNGLNLIDPAKWNDWFDFTKRYCNGRQGYFGWDATGSSNIEELKSKISSYFIRRKKEDILKELPPKQHIFVPIKMERKDKKNYDDISENFRNYLKKHNSKDINFQAEKLVRLNVLRQMTTDSKIDTAIELLENIIDGGEKAIIFSCYVAPLEKIYERFKDQAVILTGSTSMEDRKKAVDRFQNDENIKLFIGGIKSAGVGLTLTAASSVVFLDYSWVPADHDQAEDRCHRPGTVAENIKIFQLYTQNTIDEYMKKILEKKKKIFNELVDVNHEKIKNGNIFDEIIAEIKKNA